MNNRRVPTMIIDPPSPFEPPEVLWDFLRRYRDIDDPAAREACLAVGSCLVVRTHDEPEPESSES